MRLSKKETDKGVEEKHDSAAKIESAKKTKQYTVKPSAVPLPDIVPAPIISVAGREIDIPGSMNVVMGQDDNSGYAARVKAVHRLGKHLTSEEIDALYVLMDRKSSEDKLSLPQMAALKNEVANILRRQEKNPVDLARNFIAMYRDERHDEVWRDYCIQHLGAWYKEISGDENRRQAVDTIWLAANEKKSATAGTALLAFFYNIDRPGIDRVEVSAKALELAGDSDCSESARITALQICAELGDMGALSIARKIASSSAGVPLRMSAIAAIGTLGDQSDRPLLEKYASSGDVRLRKSASSALERLAGRRTPGSGD